jgi:hypothetical protein
MKAVAKMIHDQCVDDSGVDPGKVHSADFVDELSTKFGSAGFESQ